MSDRPYGIRVELADGSCWPVAPEGLRRLPDEDEGTMRAWVVPLPSGVFRMARVLHVDFLPARTKLTIEEAP